MVWPNADLAFCVQEHAATPWSLKIRVTSLLHFKARESKIAKQNNDYIYYHAHRLNDDFFYLLGL